MSSPGQLTAFVENTLRLLDLERRAEVEETARLQAELSDPELERRGLSLLRLKVAGESTGLGGRVLVTFDATRGDSLPAHRMQPGDIVTIRPLRAARGGRRDRTRKLPVAIIYRVHRERIIVACDDAPDEGWGDPPFRLDRVANDVTFRRMRAAMARLKAYERGPAARLREVCFGLRDPTIETSGALDFFDRDLDASQRRAVTLAMGSREVALIHGPPGTGKTTAVIEVIRQAIRRGEKVLASAASNVAVDNLVERLVRRGVRVVRLGHPARLLRDVVSHSLESLIAVDERSKIASDVRRELETLLRQMRKARDSHQRRELRREVGRVRGELRELEERTTRDIIASAEVVLATNTGAADDNLRGVEFDLVVLDEAAQALEAGAWIPLLCGRRAVLAGDHWQLPPVVRARDAQKGGLEVTLFQRLADRYGDEVTRMLTVQYRMHEAIMRWSSEALYDGRVKAHASVREHQLADLDHVKTTELARLPVVLIDTAGCDLEEVQEVHGASRGNEGEADIVVKHVNALLEIGVRPQEIAVITPYNAQVQTLSARLLEHAGLEIGSVDGFQGREKEAVVISMVRSNPRGEVGFLADRRRMNVAVTRARRHVAIIGDSATVASHPFLGQLIEYCQKCAYRSAWELL